MNKENLLRMADYIETVPQELFCMYEYRDGDCINPVCTSVGDTIGHCTHLDPNKLPMIYAKIDFCRWSEDFTGLSRFSGMWLWCFDSVWYVIDNTPTGAAARIRYLINHGLPENWKEQLNGCDPICYK